MNTLAVLIILALIATVAALVTGVGSMARGGEFDRKHSHQLMFARVGFQGIAILLLLAALYTAQG
ncbi:MAG: twin transmembrane helix small protein [Gammaproteobacteria bacterium]|nr:twin transmembrane helix small protein [Gammaproteobacteria bacterium]NIR83479.1 twin transmembrane helix small protein [Gammaproteobacteria bacterium]NIR91401.1 twin transmembrane helix small protein [Gammaproteobacteria bacterium]NIU04641.1 twin transmembrane helix small protein [Gammaproteobacteria bacterium]NIV51683.1 twin transmembrane helix small protein [Gammaproteobacteria bacterium]